MLQGHRTGSMVSAAPDRRCMAGRRGGAAIEYILVSTFALVVTTGALAWLGRAVKDKLDVMGEKLGLEESPDIMPDFGDEP